MGFYTDQIIRNEKLINELHTRIKEAAKFREKSDNKKREWQNACTDFQEKYDTLAFPCGYKDALTKISEGDTHAIEAGLCFLEYRPYFFRSGYMFKDILRKIKKAELDDRQRLRLQTVNAEYQKYKQSKTVE